MKVCVLTTSFPRFNGDYPGSFVYYLCKSMAPEVVSVVIAPSDREVGVLDNAGGMISVRRFRYFIPESLQKVAYGQGIFKNLRRNPLAALELPFFVISFFLSALASARKCDVIHAHWILSGLIGVLAKKVTGKPLVVTIHGTDARSMPKCLIKPVLENSDIVISAHPEIDGILKSLGFPLFHSINNMIDEERFKQAEGVDDEFGLAGKTVMSFIGRLDDFKNPMILIEAVKLIKNRETLRFLIVGDGPLRGRLEEEIVKNKLKGCVITTGFRSDVERILKSTDVFLAVSSKENVWSTSLVEAMFCAKPCILTAVGESSRYFKDGENAIVTPAGDESKLAEAIARLASDEKTRENMGAAAKKLYDEYFDRNKIKSHMISVYRGAAK